MEAADPVSTATTGYEHWNIIFNSRFKVAWQIALVNGVGEFTSKRWSGQSNWRDDRACATGLIAAVQLLCAALQGNMQDFQVPRCTQTCLESEMIFSLYYIFLFCYLCCMICLQSHWFGRFSSVSKYPPQPVLKLFSLMYSDVFTTIACPFFRFVGDSLMWCLQFQERALKDHGASMEVCACDCCVPWIYRVHACPCPSSSFIVNDIEMRLKQYWII